MVLLSMQVSKLGECEMSFKRTEEKRSTVSFKSYNEDNVSDDVLQIKRYDNMAFCCLCNTFICETNVTIHICKSHNRSVLKVFNQQAAYIIKLQEESKIIRAIQLNSKKFDGTTWPEYTETTAKYSCDQCNKIVEENDIINHEITVHKSDMMSSMRYINDWSPAIIDFNIALHYPLFRCSFCNEIIHGILSLSVHFSKRKHVKNIKLFIDIKKREYDSYKDVHIYFEPLELFSIISFENNNGTIQIKEQSVMYIKNSLKTEFIYVCFVCHYCVDKTHDIIVHLCEMKHLKHFRNIFLTYNYIRDLLISKEHSMNEIHEEFLASKEDIAIDTGSLKKHNIKEIQMNTGKYRDHNSIVIANTTNDGLCQNEKNNSGFFISLDILTKINPLIDRCINSVPAQSELNKKSALDRYNKIYSKEFLDFEEIMFTCNERKLNQLKLNLQFFFPRSDNKLFCLICNDPQLCNAQAIYEHINCKKHVTQFIKLHNNKELELLKELIEPIHFGQAKCYVCDKIVHGKYKKASKSVDYRYHTHVLSHKNTRKELSSKAECILGEFQNLWYDIHYFACVECDKRFERKIEFLEHLNAKHRRVLNNKDNSIFDFCLTCATLWYKNESCAEEFCTSYQIHCSQRTHKYLQKSNDYAVASLPQSLQNLFKNINGIADNLFNLSNDVLNDRKVIQLTNALKHILEIHLKTRFPVEICMFGSRITGLALSNSDIDIYLNFGKYIFVSDIYMYEND